MKRLFKEVVRVGTYFPPGLGGKPVTFTPSDLFQMERNGNELIRRGWPVPVGWEHQSDLMPMSMADRAASRSKHWCGDSLQFKRSKDRSKLFAVLDIEDADAPSVQRVGFVSPGLQRDWVTGDGTKYPGWSVVHVAVTPQPVNNQQGGFVPLSLPAGLVCLSLNDLKGNFMAAEDDEKPDVKPADDETETPAEEKPEGTLAPGGPLSKALAIAQAMGLILGEDTNEANFLERFVVAGQTAMAAEGDSTITQDGPEQNGVPPGATQAPAATGAVQMSMTALQSRLVEFERKELLTRVNRLLRTGRITPVIAQKLTGSLNRVELSLNADASLKPVDVLPSIEAYEKLPAGKTGFSSTSRVDLSQATVVPLDREQTGKPPTGKEAESLADQVLKTSRGK